MDLARGQGGRVEGLLEAAGQGDDQAEGGDADRDTGRRQRRPERAAARAAETDFERVAPVHPRRRVDRLLAPHRGLAGLELDRAAVDHPDDPASPSRDFGVMGDQDDRRAAAVQVVEQPQHALAGSGVEASGRLVGEDQARAVGQGPGDRDLLLLASGQPAGACASPVLEPNQRQQMAGPPAPLLELDAGEREG